METPTAEWVNVEQARAVAGVSRRTIYNWLAKGALTSQRTAGGSLRILRASLFRVDAKNPQLETDARP